MIIRSPDLEVDVLPEAGMTIRAITPGNRANILWERPGHAVPPPRQTELGPSGWDSLDDLHAQLIGGWFELSPTAGIPGTLDGRETYLHGEAMRFPWRVTLAAEDAVEATLVARSVPLTLHRRIEVDGYQVTALSRIENTGDEPVAVTHGEHPDFPRALFAGGRVHLKAESATAVRLFDGPGAVEGGPFEWPIAPTQGGGSVDLSRIPTTADGSHHHVSVRLADPLVTLTAADGIRVDLELDLETHPYLLIWRNLGALGDPANGEWDVVALEPMSGPGVGVDDAVAAGAVGRIAPGAALVTRFSLTVTG